MVTQSSSISFQFHTVYFENENCWEAKPNETINCAARTMGMIEMLLLYLVSYLRSDETNAFLQKVSLLTK